MVNIAIKDKVSTLLEMMLKTEKYNPNDLGSPGTANHVSLFSQELIEVVDVKKAIIDKGELPTKSQMERMNEYYKWCKLESAGSEASRFAESMLPNSQGTIYVIKEVRNKFGLGLKEAKDIVEAVQKRLDKV